MKYLYDEGFTAFMKTACDPLTPNDKYANLCKFKDLIATDEAESRNNLDAVKNFQARFPAVIPVKAFAQLTQMAQAKQLQTFDG